MRIYEVEILSVTIGDDEIEDMLVKNQNNIVKQHLSVAELRRMNELNKEKQTLIREKDNEESATLLNELGNKVKVDAEQLAIDLQEEESQKQVKEANKSVVALSEEIKDTVKKAEIERKKLDHSATLENDKDKLELILKQIQAEVNAVVEKGKAISPQLIAALQALGDKQLVGQLSENLSIWGHLGGKSVVDVVQNLLKGTKLEDVGSLLRKKYEDDEEDFDYDD